MLNETFLPSEDKKRIKKIREMDITMAGQLVDDSSVGIFVCDIDTYELLYINKLAEEWGGKGSDSTKNLTCYGYLLGRDTPCPNCHMHEMTEDEYREKEYETSDGRHYLIKGKLLNWHGQPAHIEYISDESETLAAQHAIRDLANRVPGGIGIYYFYPDERVEVSYLNDGFYTMLDETRDSWEKRRTMGAKEAFDGAHPEDREKLLLEIRSAVREQRVANMDIRILQKDNRYRWFNVQGRVAAESNERITLYLIFSDIDESKKMHAELNERLMQEREQMYKVLFNLIPMIISVNLTKNSYSMVNYENFTTKAAPESGSFDNLIEIGASTVPAEDREKFLLAFSRENLFKAYENGREKVELEHRQRGDDGVVRWVLTQVIFVKNEVTGDLCEITLAQNIDAEKQRQIQLRDALKTASEASRAKSEFLERMSHELRTPLNVIIGAINLAQDLQDVSEENRRYMKQANESAQYLLEIINDILDASYIQRHQFILQKDWISPKTIFCPTISMMEVEFRKKGIDFQYIEPEALDEDIQFYIDGIRCKQVLTNLLSNALKFTPPGGSIKILREHLYQEENIILERCVISDTGCGISKEFQKKMFQPFTQENAVHTGSVEGTGLGLQIVNQIVTAMNGTIDVESEPGRGTIFTVEVPLRYRNKPQNENEGLADENFLQGKRALVVEDHQLNAAIAKKLLEKKGMLVDTAIDGKEGLKLFENHEIGYYDAILMDIRMPNMNGLDAAKMIRSLDRPDAMRIPIIAVTANAYAEDKVRSLASGMNEHLTKPINPQILYQTLETWMC